jgi:cytochrome c biogenesis protein CcmG, thiol:disulfide interchange protein DsbE
VRRFWLWAPLAAFVVFLGVVASGLFDPDDRTHASKLVGKPIPAFVLAPGATGRPGLSSADFAGGPRLVNVFASWCVPCAVEAPVLKSLARQGVTIDGIAIRDSRAAVDAFLARHGNPFRAVGADPASQVQISLGSSGVPETFVVDARGIIRHQHIGELKPDDVPVILAKLRAAGAA